MAGNKAAGAASEAPAVRIAELQSAVDIHPPAGAAGSEQEEVEQPGDEATVAIDALILLASRAPREVPVKRRRRVRVPATRGGSLPADARDLNGDHSGDCSPAAGKPSPEVSGPASSPEPKSSPTTAARPPQPGGAADQHQTPKLAPFLPTLPPLSELLLPPSSPSSASSLNHLLVRQLTSPPGAPSGVAQHVEHFPDSCSSHDAGGTTRGSAPLTDGFVATGQEREVKQEALEGRGVPATQVHASPCPLWLCFGLLGRTVLVSPGSASLQS